MPLVTIPQGEIGYIFARDGQSLPPTQSLASNVRAHDFQDVAAFLRAGGQKGPQRMILREGTYAINLALFVVHHPRARLYYLPLDRGEEAVFAKMGQLIGERDGFHPVVIKRRPRTGSASSPCTTARRCPRARSSRRWSATTRRSRRPTTTASRTPSKFLLAGGQRGRQLQVLVEGTYYINRLFATDGDGAQDGRRGRHRRRGGLLHRRQRRRPLGRGLQARRAGDEGRRAASGASRCCRASTRSTPTPAR